MQTILHMSRLKDDLVQMLSTNRAYVVKLSLMWAVHVCRVRWVIDDYTALD